jgi:hypothetical protein
MGFVKTRITEPFKFGIATGLLLSIPLYMIYYIVHMCIHTIIWVCLSSSWLEITMISLIPFYYLGVIAYFRSDIDNIYKKIKNRIHPYVYLKKIKELEMCPVCQDTGADVKLGCNHGVCAICLGRMQENDLTSCPVCRHEITFMQEEVPVRRSRRRRTRRT